VNFKAVGSFIISFVAVIQTAGASDQKVIRVGVMATLRGTYAVPGQDSLRGFDLALDELRSSLPDVRIVTIPIATDASKESARDAVSRLVEKEKVDIVVGPLSGDEGLVVKEYAKSHPEMTFINGAAGAQDMTLRDPAVNVFRFHSDGAQWMAGLGEYILKSKNYNKIALIGEGYSFPFTQALGFMSEYCRLGGHVVRKFWVPLGEHDFSKVIPEIPKDVDAILVLLGGGDVVNFIRQYKETGRHTPLIGGSIAVTPDVLKITERNQNDVVGLISAAPIADDIGENYWVDFVQKYKVKYPEYGPTLFSVLYYTAGKAMILGLKEVNGDFKDRAKFHRALSKLEFTAPFGPIKLDENRAGIADTYISEVTRGPGSKLYNKTIKVTKAVTETLGMPRDTYMKLGEPSATNPECP
jgi:branched-chain amino acid transport system substrate-binding protein